MYRWDVGTGAREVKDEFIPFQPKHAGEDWADWGVGSPVQAIVAWAEHHCAALPGRRRALQPLPRMQGVQERGRTPLWALASSDCF